MKPLWRNVMLLEVGWVLVCAEHRYKKLAKHEVRVGICSMRWDKVSCLHLGLVGFARRLRDRGGDAGLTGCAGEVVVIKPLDSCLYP